MSKYPSASINSPPTRDNAVAEQLGNVGHCGLLGGTDWGRFIENSSTEFIQFLYLSHWKRPHKSSISGTLPVSSDWSDLKSKLCAKHGLRLQLFILHEETISGFSNTHTHARASCDLSLSHPSPDIGRAKPAWPHLNQSSLLSNFEGVFWGGKRWACCRKRKIARLWNCFDKKNDLAVVSAVSPSAASGRKIKQLSDAGNTSAADKEKIRRPV